ncbi:MAG TPA: RNA polymerase factor sigma-54, partial [Clostridiales bacterium]|nr:RNA polymerase factor sigma-54 [Clostridiales bacterium]
EQLLINPVLEPVSSESGKTEEDFSSKMEAEDFKEKDNTEIDWAEHFKEKGYDDISYRQWEYNSEKNDYTYEQYVSSEITLTEHLMFQLQFAPIKHSCRNIGRYIIESLDENGYMTLTPEEIAKELGVSLEYVNIVLEAIQGFDPIGVGARDLKECLLIQLRYKNINCPLLEELVNNHLEDIACNRLNNIAKALNVSVKEIQEAADIIKGLEPKPGRQFSSKDDTRYIIPDVTVEKIDGEYIVTVNESSAPRLTISQYYQKMLINSDKESNISKFLTSRLNSALWLIKSIEQRKQTIYNVVSAVVKYQIDFFEKGPKYLKTLTLKQIADEVGIHESTVSRSINGKYMQSPRGIFEIKYFFTSGVVGNGGEGISSESIKTFIKEIVENEDPKAPLSDQAIVGVLAERGIEISRRTVAKYRDEMNVPSSSKRKRF